mmetsp:Transcript_16776/g.26161  ORF Transcript_16776/g.26161 Transcript_16776/m.26161 type:complete len:93 (+) Transcript_16776:264-542(+)|eukprot:CAMPEP_0201735678 /NCGR_PEP_ID=MMETSP0593-20130828/37714_1 /ASSEMBLY_ACC=CAM_ASM_000672 /TAXON_ID=267983 /ORGANISM="Skeletonema japonicum, Strain CCMP2506" /LENGTH=92 /DNA_ID=CAMNT_0048229283 /DNA_START=114 /DNA_END=392 /DNA_ORIENTATION=-
MRPESGGRDFVEEAGGHLIALPLPLLLDVMVLGLLLLVVDFCFAALWLPDELSFFGVMIDAILSDYVGRLYEGPADDEFVADLQKRVDDECC